MVTPSKSSEEEELHNKHITVGRHVQYTDTRGTTRTGKVTAVLKTVDETPHPPKVVYLCTKEDGTTKEYINNPSKLDVVPAHK